MLIHSRIFMRTKENFVKTEFDGKNVMKILSGKAHFPPCKLRKLDFYALAFKNIANSQK